MQNVSSMPPTDTAPVFDGPPIPLTPRFIDRPFPVEALPEPYRSMVISVAEATQTDVAMAGVSVLSVLAAAVGGCAEVQVRPGWREPLTLFTATIAPPGERKSAVQAMLTDPIVTAEEELAAASSTSRTENDTLRQIAVGDAERARKAASSAEGDAKDRAKAEAISLALLAESIAVPPITRLIADDITPEAAGSLMAEQKRLAIISAEGGVLDTIAGRYSNGIPNLDLFLKGHAGDRLRIDRRGREPEYVKRPALTVGLMVQPTVIEAIGRNQQFRGRGLLARFLYAEPTSYVGTRKSQADPVPDEVSCAYTEAVTSLVKNIAGWVGDPVALAVTAEAHKSIVAVLDATETELADGGVLFTLRDWGSKYVGAVIRIAGLLHLAKYGSPGVRRPIDRDEVIAAVRLGGYFKLHAVKAFTAMQTDQDTANMMFVLDGIIRTSEAVMSERDIHRETRSRFNTVAELRPIIANLIDRGFLAPMPEPASKSPGRKPSPRYALHPKAPDYGTDCTHWTQSHSRSRQSDQSVHTPPTGDVA